MSDDEDDQGPEREADGHVPFRADREPEEGLSERVSDLAQALLANPLLGQALETAFGARERALGAQRVAMGALDIPSASDVERLERRLRSVSERVGAIEAELDRLAMEIRQLREDETSPE